MTAFTMYSIAITIINSDNVLEQALKGMVGKNTRTGTKYRVYFSYSLCRECHTADYSNCVDVIIVSWLVLQI